MIAIGIFLNLIYMKKIFSIIVISAIFASFSACSLFPKSEKQSFIDAVSEISCILINSDDTSAPGLNDQAKEIFAKNGISVEDEAEVEALSDKYKDDTEVKDALEAALAECSDAPEEADVEEPEVEEPVEE